MTFTFMFDSTKPILRELFKESFEVLSTPNIYVINMKFKELNSSGVYTYVSDMQKSNIRVVVEECSPSEIVYGEPVVFTIGFGISAK